MYSKTCDSYFAESHGFREWFRELGLNPVCPLWQQLESFLGHARRQANGLPSANWDSYL